MEEGEYLDNFEMNSGEIFAPNILILSIQFYFLLKSSHDVYQEQDKFICTFRNIK